MISLMAVFRFATQRSGSPAHLPSARSTAAPVRPMSAGPSLPAFQAAQLRTRTLRQRTRVVLDVGRHVTARLGDEVKLLDHTRSLRRRADRQPSRHHWVDCPDAAVQCYTFGTLRLRAGKDGVGQEDCLPRARSKRDDAVIGRVALGRNATDGRRKSAPAVGHVDKVGGREQRQNSIWRVRNRGT